MGKRRGRPKSDGEIKIARSVRFKPSVQKMIEAKHGKIQSWIEKKIKEEFGEVFEAEVVTKDRQGDDFDASDDDF